MLASVSLDLDNHWSYLRVHGDPHWVDYPTFLPVVVPRVLELFGAIGFRVTFFVVGRDAEREDHSALLRSLVEKGHEIGNHSYEHESWLHTYSPSQIESDLRRAHTAIGSVCGREPCGFRGPGYSISDIVLETLIKLQYKFDASTFPSVIGPVARAYYLATTSLKGEERMRRKRLFGSFADGLRPLRPYIVTCPGGKILEIPVSTHPILRFPFHLSYIVYLATFSERLASRYWRNALATAVRVGVEPSILLHPLDFLAGNEAPDLSFFPGMRLARQKKSAIVRDCLSYLRDNFETLPVGGYSNLIVARGTVESVPITKFRVMP